MKVTVHLIYFSLQMFSIHFNTMFDMKAMIQIELHILVFQLTQVKLLPGKAKVSAEELMQQFWSNKLSFL